MGEKNLKTKMHAMHEVRGRSARTKAEKTNETLFPPTCVPTLELLVHNAPVNAVVSNDLSSLLTNLNAAYDFFLRYTGTGEYSFSLFS